VKFHNPEPRGLQTMLQHLRQALEELVSEFVIHLTLRAKATAIEDDDVHGPQCASVEVPSIWADQPGPAQGIAGLQLVNQSGTLVRSMDFKCNFTRFNKIKSVSRPALARQILALLKPRALATGDKHLYVIRIEVPDKRMITQNRLERLHYSDLRVDRAVGANRAEALYRRVLQKYWHSSRSRRSDLALARCQPSA